MKNGKMFDVLMEDMQKTDERTGIQSVSRSVRIYADAGMSVIIRKVEGVLSLMDFTTIPNCYIAEIDPRYDREFVKAEIEAAILCKSEGG